jgi:hypothetical protein
MIVWLIGSSKCTAQTCAIPSIDKNQLCMFTGQRTKEKEDTDACRGQIVGKISMAVCSLQADV